MLKVYPINSINIAYIFLVVQLQAGLDRRRIILSIEPEAASLHCRHTETDNFVQTPNFNKNDLAFSAGTKYLLMGAGGKCVLKFNLINVYYSLSMFTSVFHTLEQYIASDWSSFAM